MIQRAFPSCCLALLLATTPPTLAGPGGSPSPIQPDLSPSPPAAPEELPAPPGHRGKVLALAFSPGGGLLASCGEDGAVNLWSGANGSHAGLVHQAPGPVHSLAWSPRGRGLSFLEPDGTLLELRLGRLREGSSGQAPASAGDWAALGSRRRDRALLAYRTSGVLVTLAPEGFSQREVRRGWRWAAALSPDGELLALGDEGSLAVHVLETRSGSEQEVWQDHGESISALAFSPTGSWFASGDYARQLHLMHRASGRRWLLRGHGSPVYALAFSPGGTRLASAEKGGRVLLWDLGEFGAEEVAPGHPGRIPPEPVALGGLPEMEPDALAFAPDGARLAVAGSLPGPVLLEIP